MIEKNTLLIPRVKYATGPKFEEASMTYITNYWPPARTRKKEKKRPYPSDM